jgi:membrane protein DedA with SNARE-associated domain/rhodanese-related sulfurtransferase
VIGGTLEFLAKYGYIVVFVSVLAEQVGLPVPSAPVLMAAGALAGFRRLNVFEALMLAVAASVMSDLLWFHLGRRRGVAILKFVCKVSLEPETCLSKTYSVYARYGSISLLFAKFVPGVGVLGPPMAGLQGLAPWKFVVFDGAGALIWAGAYVGAGWAFRTQLEELVGFLTKLGAYFVVLLVLGLALYIAAKYVRRRHLFRELQIARIKPIELKRLMDEGRSPTIVDLRIEIEKRDGRIPGAVELAYLDSLPEHLKVGEFVLYCSCPNEVASVQAALKLKRRGVRHVRPLEGGFAGWLELGFPIAIWDRADRVG